MEYDCKKGEEYVEAVENLQPRTQMPGSPRELHGKLSVMLTRTVKYGDPIEGLEVRWHLVSQILQALVARPSLYPHMRGPQGYAPWRVGGNVDEPMHLWYDRRHGITLDFVHTKTILILNHRGSRLLAMSPRMS